MKHDEGYTILKTIQRLVVTNALLPNTPYYFTPSKLCIINKFRYIIIL